MSTKPTRNAKSTQELRFYHHPTCSTCKKAQKWLGAHDVTVEERRIAETPPSARELEDAIVRSGLPAKRFFNTSGQSYRAGGWSEKVDALSVRDASEALAADGMLIKRPLLIGADVVLVGFREDAYAEALAGA
ncbi:MAG: arsenate reductase family protein [Myxococcales bacterium]|nr:arsenate reductase family protein [Myxococcales bacterium]MCB9628029.1 arsenate reductase family protein [Sandaracinaceae bacterium]